MNARAPRRPERTPAACREVACEDPEPDDLAQVIDFRTERAKRLHPSHRRG